MVSNTDPYITGINDWSEDYYYAAGKLRRVTTLDGYLNLYNRTGYRNYYAVKAHIGCTWEYEKGSKKAFGYPSYYPSGIMDRKPYTTYPFGLGGKEFMSTNYLDKYYFGARAMYAIMNRFNQVDPLCEEYYSVSPYAYALNNPVRYKDPTGKYVESAWDIFSLLTGVESFVSNVSAGNVGAAIVDGLGVVVDAAAVVLPVIPGGVGAAAKGIRALDKATDAVKAVDKTVDSGKAVGKASRSGKARFIGDTNGSLIDTKTTSKGSYTHPDGSRTDILQNKTHFDKKTQTDHGTTHTHEPYKNRNPDTGKVFSGADENTSHIPTYDEMMRIWDGIATRTK